MNSWLKSNALQLFTIIIGAFLIIGQWQARQDMTVLDVDRNSGRIERLEALASQERVRLDGVYLRRDLSDEQLRAIVAKLDNLGKQIESIQNRVR